MPDASISLFGTLGAAAVGCATVLLYRLVDRAPRSPSANAADASIVLRLIWPLIRLLSFYLGPHLAVRRREGVLRLLQAAELDQVFLPQEWLATRLVVAALAAITSLVLARWFGASGLLMTGVVGATVGWYTGRWLHERRKAVQFRVLRDLPVYLDVLTLAVEAGASLTVAVGWCVEKSNDGPLRRAFTRVLREIRAGRTRAEALRALEYRLDMPPITSLVGALVSAEQTGASIGQVLRAQAEQRGAERFARAEKLAMEAPVKMLGPLVLCIFPCTFIVLGFPIAMQLTRQFSQ
ncbi:MAG: type II secretion system F family protein [Steroidobacteraceae bacterium]